MIVVVGLDKSSATLAAEQGPPAVEEWQVKGILAALKDGHKRVRVLAAEGLGELLIFDTPKGSQREWRNNSLNAAKDAVPALRELLRDEDLDARGTAAWALVRLYEGAKDVPALGELLKDKDPFVRMTPAEALVRVYERAKDVPALRELLKEEDPGVRREAVAALGRVGDKQDVPALRKLLKDLDVRGWAVRALVGFYEGAKDVPALRELLKDEDPDVRQEAVAALGRVGDIPSAKENRRA
jgi:HEAT repeat protein